MPSSIPEASYDLALRAIDQQERRLAELRTRAGTLIAAASVAASFLGAEASRSGSLGFFGGVALVAYVAAVLASLYVLWPHALVLEFRGPALASAAGEANASVEQALERATEWIDSFHEANRDKLLMLGQFYTASVVALGAEILLWTLTLADTLT